MFAYPEHLVALRLLGLRTSLDPATALDVAQSVCRLANATSHSPSSTTLSAGTCPKTFDVVL